MNVLLVNMPFGAIRPAIGVSLLKSHLGELGAASQVLYLNMQFARVAGTADYHYLAERTPSQSLAGDWVFSRSIFGSREEADAQYLRAFDDRFGKLAVTRGGIAALLRARNLAEGFLENCLQQVDWRSFEVVGFTSTFTQHVASLALARRVKQRSPGSVIVFGGANCEAEMGLQLHRSFPFVDFVCSGEADISFPRLVKALMEGGNAHHIPGVISRRDGCSYYTTLVPERVKDLDELPYPNYDDYFEQLSNGGPGDKPPTPLLMESSRGCWWGEKHHCTFCGLNGTSMTFRSKSADRVLEEITYLCARYKSTFVEMVDNILDMHYFHNLIPELQKRKLKLGLFYETKANLTKEHVRALRDAGIQSIQPGIESLSTDILRIMRKGTSAAQNIQLLKWCRELGVKVMWNLIYGFPGENPADYEDTVRIVESVRHLQPPCGFGAIRLDRFSPNFASAEELGVCNVRPDRSYQYIYDLPQPDLAHLAYYFEHDYVDGRDPQQYVADACRAVRRWQGEPEERGLIYADHGEMLAVWDFRSGAEKTLIILKGHEREIYLYCDQSRSLQQIQTFVGERAAGMQIEEFLDSMIASRLMLKLDARYLSLAVRSAGTGSHRERKGKGSRKAEHVVL